MAGGFRAGLASARRPPPLASPSAVALGDLAAPAAAPPRAHAPFVERPFPFLSDEDASRSVSVGDVTSGWLVNARRLPTSVALGVLPRQAERDLAWGTEELVEVLAHAAERFHGATGRRLWVGNLGRRGGGDIPWSVSHNAGRDADVAFAYQDASGKPVDPPDLVAVDATGKTSTGLVFDVAASWAIVTALLEAPGARVQYVFVSRPLARMLLAHARAKGEPAARIARADKRMKQPSGAPHDDHFHLRLYCSKRDVEAGCETMGEVHPGVDTYAWARTARVKVARDEVRAATAEARVHAVERLALLHAAEALSEVKMALADSDERVRAAAAKALGALASPSDAEALEGRLRSETSPAVQAVLLDSLVRLAPGRAVPFVYDALSRLADSLSSGPIVGLRLLPPPRAKSPRLDWALSPSPEVATYVVARAAVELAPSLYDLGLLGPLARVASSAEGELATAAFRSLERLVAHPLGAPAASVAERARQVTAWVGALSPLFSAGRDALVCRGLSAPGHRIERLDRGALHELVRLVAADDVRAFRAERELVRLVGFRSPSLPDSKRGRCAAWLRFVDGERTRLGVGRAPPAVASACR
jgi:penicillin-insensitive murein endopeptidase